MTNKQYSFSIDSHPYPFTYKHYVRQIKILIWLKERRVKSLFFKRLSRMYAISNIAIAKSLCYLNISIGCWKWLKWHFTELSKTLNKCFLLLINTYSSYFYLIKLSVHENGSGALSITLWFDQNFHFTLKMDLFLPCTRQAHQCEIKLRVWLYWV